MPKLSRSNVAYKDISWDPVTKQVRVAVVWLWCAGYGLLTGESRDAGYLDFCIYT